MVESRQVGWLSSNWQVGETTGSESWFKVPIKKINFL